MKRVEVYPEKCRSFFDAVRDFPHSYPP
jgi:hypothetical protein